MRRVVESIRAREGGLRMTMGWFCSDSRIIKGSNFGGAISGVIPVSIFSVGLPDVNFSLEARL